MQHLAYSTFEDNFDSSRCFNRLLVASGLSTVDPTGFPLEASVILLLDPMGVTADAELEAEMWIAVVAAVRVITTMAGASMH